MYTSNTFIALCILFRSVQLSSVGDIVAIGAFGNWCSQLAGINNCGHVRIYQWVSSAWIQLGSDIDGEATSDNSGNIRSRCLDVSPAIIYLTLILSYFIDNNDNFQAILLPYQPVAIG